MRKLFYMGLESYEARYTLQFNKWHAGKNAKNMWWEDAGYLPA